MQFFFKSQGEELRRHEQAQDLKLWHLYWQTVHKYSYPVIVVAVFFDSYWKENKNESADK